ncbi:MAG: hypothetical protein LQ338_003802 [Usnochroma carphineum]|nr:MAG: hypothetical protein LQ338_003802 [Usnochroma carphineum]
MPQIKVSQPTSSGRGWRPLQDSPSNPPIVPDIWVPDAPTPRSYQSGNDTPTPAIPSTGSWRNRRRAGELVERPPPPKIRLNPPESIVSTSPEIQSSPEWQSTLERQSSSERQSSPEQEWASTRNTERPNLQNHEAAPESQGSSSTSSGNSEGQHSADASDPDDPIRPPPPAKVASHPSQLDGALDEGGPQRRRRHASGCKKLCGSLRRLPSQLTGMFKKEKTEDHKDENTRETHRLGNPEAANQAWWSKTARPFGKAKFRGTAPLPGRHNRRSARKSLRHLFSSLGAANETSGGSSLSASREANPFDDTSAPQAFGAPTHEEDTGSPVAPNLLSEVEGYLEESTSAVGAQRTSAERGEPGRDALQATSGDDPAASPILDGNQDGRSSSQSAHRTGTWQKACEVYRSFLEVNGWGPIP